MSSALECPGLISATGAPDVVVSFGAVPEHLGAQALIGVLYEAEPDRYLIIVDGIGRFLLLNGAQVVIDVQPGVSLERVRPYLLGPALGLLLLQRRRLVLHAAVAVSPGGGAVLLAGYSRRGKSTLLAGLMARGFDMLSDDLAVIAPSATHVPEVYPMFPSMKLMPDAMVRRQFDPAAHEREPDSRKYYVRRDDRFVTERRPIHAAYVLDFREAPGFDLVPLAGVDRMEALRRHVYSQRLTESMGLHHGYFLTFSRMAATARVVSVSRSRDTPADLLADRVAADLESM